MQRNMDLIRDILLAIDKHPGTNLVNQFRFTNPSDLQLGEYSFEDFFYNLALLIDGKFVEGRSEGQFPHHFGLDLERL